MNLSNWQRKYVTSYPLHIYLHEIDGRPLLAREREDALWMMSGFVYFKTIIKYEWRE